MKEQLDLALKAVDLSGDIIRKYFAEGLNPDWKKDGTPVTLADREAEEKVRSFLNKEAPEIGFLGEESGFEAGGGKYHWVLDPIDGTKSFICGVPLFGTLLALLKDGKPVLGVIDLPALGHRIYAGKGMGCFRDGQKVSVSKKQSLEKSVCLTGTVTTFEEKGLDKGMNALRRSCWIQRGWGDCYGYYLVAGGQAELMIDPVVSVWDIAPLPVIFEEAGGMFSDLQGRKIPWEGISPQDLHGKEFTAIASNVSLHAEALSFFSTKY